MSALDATPVVSSAQVLQTVRRSYLIGFGTLALVVSYLAYAWIAFDVTGLIASAKPERATLLATDAVAHKVHVTKLLRRDRLTIAVEGERTATYQTPPDWVGIEDDRVSMDLEDGYQVVIEGSTATMTVPNYGVIQVVVKDGKIVTTPPEGKTLPEWVRAVPSKFDARPNIDKRLQVSRAKIEVHRYFFGWENFFFPFRSPLATLSAGEVFDLAFSDERLDPDQSNAALIFQTFWDNPDWQHGEVFVALLETLMMAVLGTFTAAFVALPLAFLAARNFTPAGTIRFVVRRLFDFVRGIDMLIWSLIFIRAFGLGPLTGAMAIAFTDTGTLGKLFSEALENIDRKQAEGVAATGASKVQTYRFGVIPQILPILVSQTLYYLESNTRSATVIGALGAGGIGLMLVETIRTSRDWENTLYIIILTVLLVIAMDSISTKLRRALVRGRE